jgi:hypothetical protein
LFSLLPFDRGDMRALTVVRVLLVGARIGDECRPQLRPLPGNEAAGLAQHRLAERLMTGLLRLLVDARGERSSMSFCHMLSMVAGRER